LINAADVPTPAQGGKVLLQIRGTSTGTGRVVFPLPASDGASYAINLENISDTDLTVANTPTGVGTGDNFVLQAVGNSVSTIGDYVLAVSSGSNPAQNFRTNLVVTPAGAYTLPGFSVGGG
jgi:hypothetical protein